METVARKYIMDNDVFTLLVKWDKEITPSLQHKLELKESRRKFLMQMMLLPAALTSFTASSANTNTETDHQWLTIQLTQQHLFPSSKDSPGANDINATEYLKSVFLQPGVDDEEKGFILKGTKWLNDVANSMHKKTFINLNHDEKEAILKTISNSDAGDRWVSLLLLYLFEALLSAPIYGGNTNRRGWKWLQYQPGFPLPVVNKRYYELLQKSHSQ